MFREFKNYILEKDLEITFKKNSVMIVNYISIDHFESEKIIVKCEEKTVIIKGEDLRVKKLLKDEILIVGIIKNIELR